jgi:hypothetical protein
MDWDIIIVCTNRPPCNNPDYLCFSLQFSCFWECLHSWPPSWIRRPAEVTWRNFDECEKLFKCHFRSVLAIQIEHVCNCWPPDSPGCGAGSRKRWINAQAFWFDRCPTSAISGTTSGNVRQEDGCLRLCFPPFLLWLAIFLPCVLFFWKRSHT